MYSAKKTERIGEEGCLSQVRFSHLYKTVKFACEQFNYPVDASCNILSISRSAYYKWLSGVQSKRVKKNQEIAELVKKIHNKYPEKGYRRINDDLIRRYGVETNDKRILRICRILGIKSSIKHKNNGCTVSAKNPQHISENILQRKFTAEAPDEKWLTDVSEFHYYIGIEKHKLYLSAILDLYDRRIVAYVISDHNDNELVFKTFKQAVAVNPNAHPLFHSDRGYQYTSGKFKELLDAAGMEQSMSRVGKCIDNGPMEGFWGILKRERYYGRKFTSREALVEMITDYITYFNTERYQRKLGRKTPMEKHIMYMPHLPLLMAPNHVQRINDNLLV